MRRLRHLFAIAFILSILAGVVHELTHDHNHGDTCEVCILAHAPGLVDEAPVLIPIDQSFEPFNSLRIAQPFAPNILHRSRSPPLV